MIWIPTRANTGASHEVLIERVKEQFRLARRQKMEKPVNINEAVQRIKKVGESNVRAVPMAGTVNAGLYAIEVHDGNGWAVIAEGITQLTADNIIKQATNRLICG